MINVLAIANYRSLHEVILPLRKINVITGNNGSGKSSLYKALRLIADIAQGKLIQNFAQEGGFSSALWAGPEAISRFMQLGEQPIQCVLRKDTITLKLGFASDEYSYAVLGLPPPRITMFGLDPHIKSEGIWHGNKWRSASALVERKAAACFVRSQQKEKQIIHQYLLGSDSIFTQCIDPVRTPEILHLREKMRAWRFYQHLRCDLQAPARQVQIGSYTPILAHDGADLAAALQMIRESDLAYELEAAIEDAFPKAKVDIYVENNRFYLKMWQHGLLRPLSVMELSDGTLRYLLLIAALLSPRPPELLVLNEPESSLHPDLLPVLARLISGAAQKTQIIVISHANTLVNSLIQNQEV